MLFIDLYIVYIQAEKVFSVYLVVFIPFKPFKDFDRSVGRSLYLFVYPSLSCRTQKNSHNLVLLMASVIDCY